MADETPTPAEPDEVPLLADRVHGGYGAVGRKL